MRFPAGCDKGGTGGKREVWILDKTQILCGG